MKVKTPNLAQRARSTTGLTQQAFADIYRIDVGTLRGWEQGRRIPDKHSTAYLTLIVVFHDLVASLLERAAQPGKH